MKTAIKTQTILTAIALFTLSACGGGGASSNLPEASNISPSATAQTHTIDEDINLALTLSGTDSDGSITSYAITTQPTNGVLTGTGANLIYTPDLNFNGSDSLAFTVTDNDGATSSAVTIDITVNAVNDAPVIALADSYDSSENTLATGLLLNLYATDPELDDISVSLGQEGDSSLFTIDSTTSELRFNNAPDFENPADTSSDNSYQVSVIYTDNSGAENSKLVDINVTDESEIQMVMTFPTPNANLGGEATEVTLKGSLDDNESIDASLTDISSVTVNGRQATLTNENANWSVTMPVSSEEIDLEFVVTISENEVFRDSQHLFNTEPPVNIKSPNDGVLDQENNRILLVDNVYDALMAFDLNTHEITIISDKEHGSGIDFEFINGITLDSQNNRVFVSDYYLDAILEVNLATGNRSIVSDDDLGIGPYLSIPGELSYDAISKQLYLVDYSLDALINIDITSGDRVVISDDTVGTGELMETPKYLVIDSANDVAYVSDYGVEKVFEIDLSTGNRTVLSSSTVGSGVVLDSSRDLGLSQDKSSLFVVQGTAQSSVVEIDLTTLVRTTVASSDIGEGINLERPRGVIFDDKSDQAWVLDLEAEGIILTNLTSGNRELLGDTNLNPFFQDPKGLVIDANNNRLLIIDEIALYAVDISGSDTSGEISVISNNETGTGPSLLNAKDLMFDEANNRVFTLSENEESQDVLISIDLSTGNRTQLVDFNSFIDDSDVRDLAYNPTNNHILYTEDIGSSTLNSVDLDTLEFTQISDLITDENYYFIFPTSLTVDPENNVAYVIETQEDLVLSINLSTGDTTNISSEELGTGPILNGAYGTILDATNNRLLIADEAIDQIIALDLATGNRTVLSESSYAVPLELIRNPVLDADNNRLFIADFAEDNIYVIDLETGERAYVTH